MGGEEVGGQGGRGEGGVMGWEEDTVRVGWDGMGGSVYSTEMGDGSRELGCALVAVDFLLLLF